MNWWEQTEKNADSVCSERFRTLSGVNISIATVPIFSNFKNTVGWHTDVPIIVGAGNIAEKMLSVTWVATAWCGGAFIAGGIDAEWQIHHNGEHLGMSIGDTAIDWWEESAQWSDHQSKKIYNWWEGKEKEWYEN